jgi:YVTN family beta-propeller protein
VLQNSGGNNLAVPGNGAFTFPTMIASGTGYGVTVLTQPSNPSQTCTVGSGSGTVGSANVTNVAVSCSTNTYAVGGNVSGLSGSGLVLEDNGGDDLTINSSGGFTFPKLLASATAYSVTVKTQPSAVPAQSCVVSGGGGTVTNAAVTTVSITCTTLVAKFVYVANSGSNNVSAYTINAATGALTAVPGSPFAADQGPLLMRADAAGKFLFVSNQGSATGPPRLSVYTIDGTTGALTQAAHSPFDLGAQFGPAPAIGRPMIDPSGSLAYVGIPPQVPAGSPELYGATVDSGGNLTVIPGMPFQVGYGIQYGAFSAGGKILYLPHNGMNANVGQIWAWSVSSPSGALTAIGAYVTGGSTPFGVVFNAAGTLAFTPNFFSSVSVFSVDAATGALTLATGSPVSTGTGSTPTGLVLHPTQNFVYVASANYGAPTSTIAGFQFDAASGALTPLAGSPYPTHGTNQVVTPIIDPLGKFLFVVNSGSNTIQAFAIDPASGVLTDVPGSPFASAGTSPSQAWMDPSGKYLYSADSGSNTVSAYAINAATGAVSVINSVPAGTTPQFPEVVGLQ